MGKGAGPKGGAAKSRKLMLRVSSIDRSNTSYSVSSAIRARMGERLAAALNRQSRRLAAREPGTLGPRCDDDGSACDERLVVFWSFSTAIVRSETSTGFESFNLKPRLRHRQSARQAWLRRN